MIIWFCVFLPLIFLFAHLRPFSGLFMSTKEEPFCILCFCLLVSVFFRFQIHKIPHTVCPKTKTNFPVVYVCSCPIMCCCSCPINIAITSRPTSLHCVVYVCVYCLCCVYMVQLCSANNVQSYTTWIISLRLLFTVILSVSSVPFVQSLQLITKHLRLNKQRPMVGLIFSSNLKGILTRDETSYPKIMLLFGFLRSDWIRTWPTSRSAFLHFVLPAFYFLFMLVVLVA